MGSNEDQFSSEVIGNLSRNNVLVASMVNEYVANLPINGASRSKEGMPL